MTSTTCPFCSSEQDAAASIGTQRVPGDGDISICVHCREVSLFVTKPQLHRRKPTAEESEAMAKMPELQTILSKLRAIQTAPPPKPIPPMSDDDVLVDRWISQLLKTKSPEDWDQTLAQLRTEPRFMSLAGSMIGPTKRLVESIWRRGEGFTEGIVRSNMLMSDLPVTLLDMVKKHMNEALEAMIFRGASAASLGQVKIAGTGSADGMEKDLFIMMLDEVTYEVFRELLSHLQQLHRSKNDPAT